MKTILCLTDFSDKAANAAQTAVYLASRLRANLFLFNTCIDVPAVPSYGRAPFVLDEISQREHLAVKKLKDLKDLLDDVAARLDRDAYQPMIHTEAGDGALGISIAELCEIRDIEFIVMGGGTAGHENSVLKNCQISEVINFASRPVLTIPNNIKLKEIKEIVFATDFNEEDHNALSFLVDLGIKLNSHITVTHVHLTGKKDIVPFEKKLFLEKIFNAGFSNVSYKEFNARDLEKRLGTICEKENTDLLAVMHRQHSFFVRLFSHSTTKAILAEQTMPMMIFPSSMTG